MSLFPHTDITPDGRIIYYATAIPVLATDGPFVAGSLMYNTSYTVGSPFAWICTTGGAGNVAVWQPIYTSSLPAGVGQTYLSSSTQQAVSSYISVPLTSANIIGMEATPFNLIPAPGAGKLIIIDQLLFEMTTTATAFTGGGAVSFVYHGTGTSAVTSTIPTGTITAGAGTTYTIMGPLVVTNGQAIAANLGIDITNASAPFAAGTGSAIVQIGYSIYTL